MLGTLTEQEIKEVLEQNMLGRIGCREDNDIYIVPVTYLYVGDAVVCHSLEGRKVGIMRHNPSVCFEVEDIQDHRNWKCVVAQGLFEEITDRKLIDQATKKLTDISLRRKASLTALPPSDYEDGPKRPGVSVFYRIRFSKVSGRYERSLF